MYRCEEDGGVELLQVYKDEDEEEMFFTCCWCVAQTAEGATMLAISGQNGNVRVINTAAAEIFRTLKGHGNSVNDVKAHPLAPHIILSASKDESIRMWNIDTAVCVAIFAGAVGHRNEVLSLDIKPTDPDECAVRFISGAMDNMVKVWELPDSAELIKKSEVWDRHPGSFPTSRVQAPIYSSSRIHNNYVDCVRCYGDLFLSKSVERRIQMWQGSHPNPITLPNLPFLSTQPSKLSEKYKRSSILKIVPCIANHANYLPRRAAPCRVLCSLSHGSRS